MLHRHGSKHDIYRNPLRFEEIKDGTSHTAMLVESHDAGVVWTEPRDLDAATMRAKAIYAAATPPAKQGPSSPHAAQRSVTYFSDLNRPHPSGAHMAMADGSVRFVSENVDPEVVKQLNRRDGGP